MNLRRRFVVYLSVVHLMLGALAWVLLQRDRAWLVGIELVFAVSLGFGITIVTRLSSTLVAVRHSAQMLREGEFTTRFIEVGHADIDTMIGVYNRMVDGLREERVRLQEQQYFLGQLLTASPGGIIILDHDRHVSSVNPAAERLLLTEAAAVVGGPLSGITSPIGEALSRLEPGDTRVVALPSGRRVRTQCAAFVERGHPRLFYLVEELTEELRQTEKSAYEKLIRMMSHEVNNSVGATRSLLQSSLTFAEGLPDIQRSDHAQALGIASARLERLNTFMRSFADVVRMPKPTPQPCDVDRLIDDCVALIQAQTDPDQIRWVSERLPSIGVVQLDAAQMEQALINILKNATEAIPALGGRITIRTGYDHELPFVEIEDSGPGLPEEVREHLFTPFFTTKQNGQGIGLTLVQEVLRRHDFDYSLDGPPGGPTRFRIMLATRDASTKP